MKLQRLHNLHIGTRLGLGFGLVLLLLVALALASLSRLAQLQESLDRIVNEDNVVIGELADMRQAVNVVAIAIRGIAVMTEEDELKAELKRLEQANRKYQQSKETLEALIKTDAGIQFLAAIEQGQKMTTPAIEKTVRLALKQGDVVPVLLATVVPSQRIWLQAIDDAIQIQKQLAIETSNKAKDGYEKSRSVTILLATLAVMLGGLIAWTVTHSITQPLRAAVNVARRVADGDLTTRVEVRSTDETGQLMEALRDMNESLMKIVGQVREGTDTIATASREIAEGNVDLSARTEEQADALQTTSSSMEELTATVKHNAENAIHANQLAASASEIALRGGSAVSKVVETMGSINDSARKIVDIIGVIDGIAFQTNILALNAAVEAARAGEQGRGFAVVASEVRNLAQRSAAAAKEIKTLIGDSVEKVGAGTKLVDQAGATMGEVVTSVRQVADIIGAIAAASREQIVGIEQVNAAINQMDSVTQQNAALVDEASKAANAMQEQAGKLSDVVSLFKLGVGYSARDGAAQRRPELLSQAATARLASPPSPHASEDETVLHEEKP